MPKNHRNKQKCNITLSPELTARLLKYKKEKGMRSFSQAVEFSCWQHLTNLNLSLEKLEEAEFELARAQTKIEHLKRRKELINEIQS